MHMSAPIGPPTRAMTRRTGAIPVNRRIGAGLACLAISLTADLAIAAPVPTPMDSSMNEAVLMLPKKTLFGTVRLETTVFRPPGNGPFPVVVINHGKAPGNPSFQGRARFARASREFLRRGYAVVLPMRQGFSRSEGYYQEPGCNLAANGEAQAEDVDAAIEALSGESWFDRERIVIVGQSHGGWTALAAAGGQRTGLRAVINFAGGLRQTQCAAWQSNLARAAGELGARARVPSLWFYGENDSFFGPELVTAMHAAWREAGGRATLVAFGVWPHGDAHGMFDSREGPKLWLPHVERMLADSGLPWRPVITLPPVAHRSTVPPASGFAALEDVEALPTKIAGARRAYPDFLAAPPPKAFAVSAGGAWAWSAERADAIEVALERCRGHARDKPCALYAVDDTVVWSPFTPGSSSGDASPR